MRLFTTILVSAVTSVAVYLLMHVFVAPRLAADVAEVPSIIGLTPETARTLLEARQLLVVVDAEKSDVRVTAGTVCEQRPLSGSKLKVGETVHVAIARSVIAVPKLIG